jgi:glycosyltransferase domain-containing protein
VVAAKVREMITILIPTYNRPSYLKRLLGYYSDCRVTHAIIVADGSRDEIKKTNKDTIASFPNLKALHLDRYSPETTFNIRLSDALNHVNTKYCVICADDDFITPKGISQSVDFLESNPDYAVAHGRYIFFNPVSNGDERDIFRWTTIYSNESISSTDPAIRVYQHLSKYSTRTFYAAHRTEFLKWLWTETSRYTEDTDAFFNEVLASLLTLAYGKMKCLDVLYSVKDRSSTREWHWQTFRDYVKAGTYKQQYARFRECLSAHLSKQSRLDPGEAEKVIDEAMKAFMKMHCPDVRKMHRIVTLAPLNMAVGWMMDRMNYHGRFRRRLGFTYARLMVFFGLKEAEAVVTEPVDEDVEMIKRRILSTKVTLGT